MGIMTAEMKPALQGVMPAIVFTCGLDGTPNAAVVSQVYRVDDDHVALSFQFFNKTIRNIRENPFASATVLDPTRGWLWFFELQFLRSETTGAVFEEMEIQLEAIASADGMTGVFKLKAADIYKVHSARRVPA